MFKDTEQSRREKAKPVTDPLAAFWQQHWQCMPNVLTMQMWAVKRKTACFIGVFALTKR